MSNQDRRTGRRGFLKQTALAAVAAQVAVTNCGTQAESGAVVETQYGRVRGVTDDGIHRFLGIHYGGDTSGNNRFQPPTKPTSWTGVQDALEWGNVAPQALPTGGYDYSHAVQWNNPPGGQGEDCLVLNVWTPGLDDARRPVMFSIHGGGYSSGAGSNPVFNGTPLAQYGDVVVVTINHRLGSLGYLHLGEMEPQWSHSGVAGMMDIVAALEWVRDNIGNFGGDPGNVMIFGQSGGGGKVSHLMAMPSAKGLFHKAAIQSGSTLRSGNPEDANTAAEHMLAQIGFGKDRVRELQTISWQMMIGAQMTVGGRLGPIVDGDVIPRNPFDPDAPEISADVPVMVGTTLHDSAYSIGSVADEKALAERAREMFGARGASVIEAYRQARPNDSPLLLLGRMATDRRGRPNAITLCERKAALGRAPGFPVPVGLVLASLRRKVWSRAWNRCSTVVPQPRGLAAHRRRTGSPDHGGQGGLRLGRLCEDRQPGRARTARMAGLQSRHPRHDDLRHGDTGRKQPGCGTPGTCWRPKLSLIGAARPAGNTPPHTRYRNNRRASSYSDRHPVSHS